MSFASVIRARADMELGSIEKKNVSQIKISGVVIKREIPKIIFT